MQTVVIIGGGNMGAAIARGLAARANTRVLIAEPDPAKREQLGATCPHVELEVSAAGAVARAGAEATIVLAVKPQMFDTIAEELLRSSPAGEKLVVSIMAGVTTSRLFDTLNGSQPPRIVRAMPNLPLAYGAGATALCKGPGATAADLAAAHDLFRGDRSQTIELDESLMDAFTAVAGSGPAYLFLLAEAMERGAAAVGFDTDQAAWMVLQTFQGATAMLASHAPAGPYPESAANLRQRVMSKGGTTEAALSVLESRGMPIAVEAAIVAARDRGRELGRRSE